MDLIYRFTRRMAWLAAKIWLRHRTLHAARVPRKGGFLLAVNHQSHLDPILAGISLPRPIAFLARKTLFRPRPWGWYLQKLHAIPLDRDAGGDAGSFRTAIRLVQEGLPVLIFPEGTRSTPAPDRFQLGELKSGIVRLAQLAGVPVVPAVIWGSGYAMGRGRSFPRRVRTGIVFGEPLVFGRRDDSVCALNSLEQSLQRLAEEAPPGAWNAPPDRSRDGAVIPDENSAEIAPPESNREKREGA